jgi:hypothetical protein
VAGLRPSHDGPTEGLPQSPMTAPDVIAISRLGLVLLISYSISLAFWPMLRLGGRMMWTAAWLASPALCLTPLIIPADSIRLRALAAVVAVDLLGKVFDVARRRGAVVKEPGALRRYVAFLPPVPIFVMTGEERAVIRRVDTPLAPAALRTAAGSLFFVACWSLLNVLEASPALRSNFVLDHAIKMVLFVVTMSVCSSALVGLERLLGYQTNLPMLDFWKARTPAEFWLRYNTRVQTWFARNIFLPTARRGRPVWGVVCVFVVSAAIHEVMFDVATSKIDGAQAAFFLLQIPAVLLSPRLERFAKRGGRGPRMLAHALTIGWFLVTSVLFFRGVERVFPNVYAGDFAN